MFATTRSFIVRVDWLLAVMTLLITLAMTSARPVAAQGEPERLVPPIGCDVLTECGYIRMHAAQPGAANLQVFTNSTPTCQQLAFCDYIIAHSMNFGRVATVSIVIPPTGDSALSSALACGGLPECGYIQFHSGQEGMAASQFSAGEVLPPACDGHPICDYLKSHAQP